MRQAAPARDSLAAVLRKVFEGDAYRWEEVERPLGVIRRWWEALVAWLASVEANHPALFRLLVWALVAGLAAIAVHAVWVLLRTVRGSSPRAARLVEAAASPRDSGWFAREADRLAAAGRYAAAIQADFVRFLLELDRRDLVRFHPAKTPREYPPEARLSPEGRRELADLVGDLYRFAFAGDPCGPSEYAGWRSRTDPERYAAAY